MENTAPVKKYYDELNIFRGLVIIWVIIGHSFDTGTDFWGFLHGYAYTFHMKAFFLISGILFARKILSVTSFKDCALIIKDRFLRLMVPYFFFTAVSFVLKFFLNDYANNKLSWRMVTNSLIGHENPNGGIWFLYAMFIINVFAVLLWKLPAWAGLLLCTAMYILNSVTGYLDYPLIDYLASWGIFFYIGVFLYPYYDRISSVLIAFFKKKKVLTTGISLLILGLSFVIVKYVFDHGAYSMVVNFAIIIYNILTYYCLSLTVEATQLLKKPLMTVGEYGMDIYMIGYYVQITLRVVLMSMLALPYLAYALPMCIFGLLLPIPISKYIVRRFRITRILVLGDYKKEVKEDGKKA